MDSILFCALFAILQWTGTKCIPANEMKFEHMKVLDDAELDSLRQKNEVSAVYYYKRGKILAFSITTHGFWKRNINFIIYIIERYLWGNSFVLRKEERLFGGKFLFNLHEILYRTFS